MILESGQRSYNSAKAKLWRWANQSEQRLYLGGVGLALFVMALALVLGLLSGPTDRQGVVIAQFVAGSLVFAFSVYGDMQTAKGQMTPQTWQRGAIICAGLVIVTGLFTGEFFNIMLAPLLVGIAHRRENQRLLIGLGLGAVVLIALEVIVFAILGQNSNHVSSAATSLTAVAAITLSLATFMRRYQSEVEEYQDEAATKASEMEVAHEIQTSLMPPPMFTSGNWTLAARSLPARDVGGDFYEYVQHPHLDNTISGIAIGDVAGKGIPAALQMAVVRTLFRIEARRRIFPGETLMSVNVALQAERSFGMVTMLYAFIDINSNTLHLANAGHNYPLLLNGTLLEEVKMPGLPLGIDDGIDYEEKVIKITPGTSVIFYTDGVVEAMDNEDNLFSFERLKEAVQANQNLGPVDMVDKILAEIANFTKSAPQSDDITVLVLQYHPQPAEADETPKQGEPVGVAADFGDSRKGSLGLETGDDGVNWI